MVRTRSKRSTRSTHSTRSTRSTRSTHSQNKRKKRKKSLPLKNKNRSIPLIGFIAVVVFKRLLELLGKEWILFYYRNGQSTQKLIDKLTEVIIKLSPYDYTLPDRLLAVEEMSSKQKSLQKLAFVVSQERYVAYDPSLGMFSTDLENVYRIFMGAYDIYVLYETVSCFGFIGQAPRPLAVTPLEIPLEIPEETPSKTIDPLNDPVPSWWINKLFDDIGWKERI